MENRIGLIASKGFDPSLSEPFNFVIKSHQVGSFLRAMTLFLTWMGRRNKRKVLCFWLTTKAKKDKGGQSPPRQDASGGLFTRLPCFLRPGHLNLPRTKRCTQSSSVKRYPTRCKYLFSFSWANSFMCSSVRLFHPRFDLRLLPLKNPRSRKNPANEILTEFRRKSKGGMFVVVIAESARSDDICARCKSCLVCSCHGNVCSNKGCRCTGCSFFSIFLVPCCPTF